MARSIAVAIFAEYQEMVVLVRDTNKPAPHYWKLPGGRGEYGETPDEAGARELEEETGVVVPPEEILNVYEEPRKNHHFHLLHAKAQSLEKLKGVGDEGEVVKVFTKEEMRALPDFMPAHKAILQKIGLW